MQRRVKWGAAWAVVMLSACGGGGGGGADPPVSGAPADLPPLSAQCVSGAVARFEAEPLAVGRSSELHLVGCRPLTLQRIRWSFEGPSALAPLSARSASVSVTPTQAGAHRATLRYTDDLGRSQSASFELNVAPKDLPRGLLTRGEPSAWSGDRLSLRAWPQGYGEAELVGAGWRWERVSGPEVELSDAGTARVLLTAPTVTQDQLLVLRATLTLAGGASVSDEFRLLVQPPPQPAADPLFGDANRATRTLPWQEDGPWSAQLARCVYNPALRKSGDNLCTLGELPLLGQASATPASRASCSACSSATTGRPRSSSASCASRTRAATCAACWPPPPPSSSAAGCALPFTGAPPAPSTWTPATSGSRPSSATA
jgi:hypothetical protein